MKRPTRGTPAGRAYLDLQKQARNDRRPTDELLQLYVLEGLLDRLARSAHAKRFILKGGVLLAAFGQRRPTRDIDLHAEALSNEMEAIRRVICEIADIGVDDGLVFDTGRASAEVIRDEEPYAGVRVVLSAGLATARLHVRVDVNVGDPITPPPSTVHVPRLRGGEIVVRGYPLAMVHAEKIVTALARGTANTRWRDFADLYLLSRHLPVDASELTASIRRVATHRQVEIQPLAQVLEGYGEIGQGRWTAWRRKQRLEEQLPAGFGVVVEAVVAFGEPAVAGEAKGFVWDPKTGTWS